MKKYLLLTGVILGILVVTWTAIAQDEGVSARRGGGGSQNLTAEQRAQMRERFQIMSEEERQQFREQMRARFENMSEEERAQMRQRFSGRTRLSQEEQLAAIKKVEEQLGKLKASIESNSTSQGRNFRDMSEEERTKFREERTKVREARQATFTAINEELNKLNPPRPTPEQMETLRELTEIRELAEKEKATETAKRLVTLIEKQTQQLGPMMIRGGRGAGAPETSGR
ncbi:MAG: hypothetical protein JXA82_16760 [Sedimentisphaerales bacterium]|nr:hypothetical protein [Sedimentisphaerales bacterium]